MQNNKTAPPATFGQLQIGDRFYFLTDRQKTVYQVTKENHYNRVEDGKKLLLFDKRSSLNRTVRFTRQGVLPFPADPKNPHATDARAIQENELHKAGLDY